jgi:hypothetical protein
MLPPLYVLKRGEGSSRERAFVWFALLQQLDLDVCVIAVPDKSAGPRPWLAGVLIPNGDKTEVYLFDARLGLAVPGPKGQGIATLAQLQADPHLLDQLKSGVDGLDYDVDAGQLAGSEIWLIAPLSALSARMRFLQEGVLEDFDRITLAVRLPELMEKCEACGGPSRVWLQASCEADNALRLFCRRREGEAFSTPARSGLEKINRLRGFGGAPRRVHRHSGGQVALQGSARPIRSGIVPKGCKKCAELPAVLRQATIIRRLVLNAGERVETFLVLPGGSGGVGGRKMTSAAQNQQRSSRKMAARVVADPDDNPGHQRLRSPAELRGAARLRPPGARPTTCWCSSRAERLRGAVHGALAGGAAATPPRLRDKTKEAWRGRQ